MYVRCIKIHNNHNGWHPVTKGLSIGQVLKVTIIDKHFVRLDDRKQLVNVDYITDHTRKYWCFEYCDAPVALRPLILKASIIAARLKEKSKQNEITGLLDLLKDWSNETKT